MRWIGWVMALCMALFWADAARADRTRYVLSTGGSAVLAEEDGHVLIPAGQFGGLTALGDSGLYAATPLGGSLWGVIDARGQALTEFAYTRLEWDGRRIVFMRHGQCGVMNREGVIEIEPRYRRLISAEDGGYLALKTDPLDDLPDLVYRISQGGEEESTGIYVLFGLQAMSEGLCEAVNEQGLYGCLGADGQWAIEPRFDWCGAFVDGLAVAARDAQFGLIDKTGAWVVEPGYRRIERSAFGEAPLLGQREEAAELIDPTTRAVTVRFEGATATFSGEGVLLTGEAGLRLVDWSGATLLEAEKPVISLYAAGGCCIAQTGFDEAMPFSLIGQNGEALGAYQDLTYAGTDGSEAYFIASRFDTVRTDYPALGLTFYDEVAGTRRCALINGRGETIADGFLHLKRDGQGLLLAETDEWIGLIRVNGDVVVRLEKEE